MRLDLQQLQLILTNWPESVAPESPIEDGIDERIRQILRGSSPTRLLKNDLLPLIRHYLLRETDRTGRQQKLRVPASAPWPDRDEWQEHAIFALRIDDSHLLTALPWHPEWLTSGELGAFAQAFTDQVVRVDGRCRADPFIVDATGYTEYSCPGQREAVRAAFLMQPGHTLLVNLPTGSGKSLVGQAPALVYKEAGNLTLFIVPTVALALDQARQMEDYFRRPSAGGQSWPLAWYGGMSPSDRSEIRHRISLGTQRILFTSPEALMTSLLRTVFDASAAGMLRYLVIDEAHLVTQWGDDFRPAFQALAGLRNALLRHSTRASLRTLLLSATFTQDTIEALASLFGPLERVHMLSAVHLRPEPQYWFHRAISATEKEERILEALRHAPRPFVLYLTTPADAVRWRDCLQSALKLTRIACFHGKTSDQDRKSILRRWQSNELDGVVATSAFGVGIDKADVRTIIHATIPESLDRFYQEVGRAGRDGRASVSLLVHDSSEWGTAKSLGKPTIISDNLGMNRWNAMYRSRQVTDVEDLFQIDIDAIPEHVRGSNEYNVSWNMRTLLLMVRARLLVLEVRPANDQDRPIGEFSPSSPLAAMSCIRLRILNDAHKLPAVWEQEVGASREATRRTSERNIELMNALLNQGTEVGATLARLYRSTLPRWPVSVAEVCGGCAADRYASGAERSYHMPYAIPLFCVEAADFNAWRSTIPWVDPQFAHIFFDAELPGSGEAILQLLRWLTSACALQEISTSATSRLATTQSFRQLYRRSPTGVLVHRDTSEADQEPYSPLARASILETEDPAEYERVRSLQRPYHVVVLPARMPDPANPTRLLAETAQNAIRLDALNAMTTQ